MKCIESPENEQLKHIAKLLSASKERRKSRQAVLEGIHLLDAFLQSGKMPKAVFVPDARCGHTEVLALLEKLPENLWVRVSNKALHKISSLTESLDVLTLIDLPEQNSLPSTSDCIVLDSVQDPGNIGTILRSAAASGVQCVVLGKGCADVYAPKVFRAAMGAHFLLDIYERVDLLEWRKQFSGRLLATALSSQNHFSLYELDLRSPSAWVFGNEGCGVSKEVLAVADATVKIPMLGATESLNVAMAATVCLFEQMRQRL